MNRRYPEATVVETYRLSEWAHFMQLSGELPDGATAPGCDKDYRLCEAIHNTPCTEGCEEFVFTDGENEERDQLQRNAVSRNYVIHLDSHHRIIRLTSAETETGQRRTSPAQTEQISEWAASCQLFDRTHASGTTCVFAFVSWFDGPFADPDSKLWFVDTTKQSQSFIHVTLLSKPLVTAFDEEEPGKLWTLKLVK